MKKRYSFLSPLLAILLTTCGPKVEPTYLTYELLINKEKVEKNEQEDYYKVHFTDTLAIKASATGPKATEVKWKLFSIYSITTDTSKTDLGGKSGNQINNWRPILEEEPTIDKTLEFTFEKLKIPETDFKKLNNDTSVIIRLGFGSLGNKKEVSNARNEGNFKFKIDWTPKKNPTA